MIFLALLKGAQHLDTLQILELRLSKQALLNVEIDDTSNGFVFQQLDDILLFQNHEDKAQHPHHNST